MGGFWGGCGLVCFGWGLVLGFGFGWVLGGFDGLSGLLVLLRCCGLGCCVVGWFGGLVEFGLVCYFAVVCFWIGLYV